jgi:GNAT superfamily N-acetyltransferase
MKTRFLKLCTKDDHAVFVAEIESECIVGVVHIREDLNLHAGSFAEIAALVVDDKQQGKGIGRALMEQAETWASKRHLKKMILYTNVTREKAHDFYRALSYSSDKSSHVFIKSILP